MILRRDERFFREAAITALRSEVHVRVGVVLARGRRPYVWAHNVAGPVANEPWSIGHAEIRALNAPFFPTKPKTTLYVARIDRAGTLMASHPCQNCFPVLEADENIKRIVYYDGHQLREKRK